MSLSNDEAILGDPFSDPFLEQKSEKITKKCRCHQRKNGKKMPKMDHGDNSVCDVRL